MKSVLYLLGQVLFIALTLGLVLGLSMLGVNYWAPVSWSSSIPWETIYVVLLYLSLFQLIKVYYKSHDFPIHPGPFKTHVFGFLLSVAILSCCWGIGLGSGLLTWQYLSLPLPQLLHILGLAFAIAWFEEAFFRGLVLHLLRQQYPLLWAMLLQALLFSLLHQFNTQWDTPMRIGSGLGLFLSALILAQVAHLSQSLGWSIGLHSGWIFLCQWASYSGAIRLQQPLENGQKLYFQEVNPVSGIVGILLLTGVSYVIMSANRTQMIRCTTSER